MSMNLERVTQVVAYVTIKSHLVYEVISDCQTERHVSSKRVFSQIQSRVP